MIVLKEEDTRKTAIRFAKSISKNCVVCLNGDLGAGKTTFSRYFIQTLIKDKKVTGEIPSPTFSLLQTYKDKNFIINHYDFYRLENSDELIELDYGNSISTGLSFTIKFWAIAFIESGKKIKSLEYVVEAIYSNLPFPLNPSLLNLMVSW